MADTFTIKLPVFEGPFDLLLFFIERDELDIYNIPIAKITDDFLTYLRQAQSLNIDLASEFIVVAATLMRIKAKMLLPRKHFDEAGNEIDPRTELVDRLLEYKKYKSTLEELRTMEEKRAQMTPRGFVSVELKKLAERALADAEMESINLFKLLKVFEKVMLRFDEQKRIQQVHTIYAYRYTIQEQRIYLNRLIRQTERVNFEAVFMQLENRLHAIVTFLALLEMLNERLLTITQGEGFNNFWLSKTETEHT